MIGVLFNINRQERKEECPLLSQNRWVFPDSRSLFALAASILLFGCASAPEQQFRTMKTNVSLKAPILSPTTLAQINPSYQAPPKKAFSLAKRVSQIKEAVNIEPVFAVSVLDRVRRDEALPITRKDTTLTPYDYKNPNKQESLNLTTNPKDKNNNGYKVPYLLARHSPAQDGTKTPNISLRSAQACSKMLTGKIDKIQNNYQLTSCQQNYYELVIPKRLFPNLHPLLNQKSTELYAEFWGTVVKNPRLGKAQFEICQLNYISTKLDPCSRPKISPMVFDKAPFWSIQLIKKQLKLNQLGNNGLFFHLLTKPKTPYVIQLKYLKMPETN
jgi:hypothetical protein